MTFESPYRNVNPQVKYVGDEACAQCHPHQTATYHQHPMGRSLAPVSKVTALESYAIEARNPFQTSGFEFRVEQRGGRVFHKTLIRDGDDKVVCETEAEVAFAVGSGTRGRSYLINRDGYLFESPLSWYSERKVWDLSPHLAGAPQQLYRPVAVGCLFCHSNYAEAVEHAGNRYRPPIFHGHAIGCERCHGPGELHVQLHKQGEVVADVDHTIVNPARLAPALREAVCQQCHLQGLVRILRRGQHPFDFRPGLPLHLFWSVFIRSAEMSDQQKFSSHVEQMDASRCFRDSKGKLGCISCHDPHALPAPNKRQAYYRNRCLNCHSEKSCSLPLQTRREKNREDSCPACHMPPINLSNIAHMTSTDHRIVRRADDRHRPAQAGRAPETTLVLFHQEEMKGKDKEFSRDLGVALMDLAGIKQPEQNRLHLAKTALPLLDAAVQASADDVPAGQAKGYALWLLGRKEEALAAFKATLTKAPQREEVLMYAAGLAAQMGLTDGAIDFWQRLLRVNPWSVRAHYELAKLRALRGQWRQAGEACQAALRLNPFDVPARKLLIVCCLRKDEKDQADAEFDKLMKMSPRGEKDIHNWYANELEAAGYKRK